MWVQPELRPAGPPQCLVGSLSWRLCSGIASRALAFLSNYFWAGSASVLVAFFVAFIAVF